MGKVLFQQNCVRTQREGPICKLGRDLSSESDHIGKLITDFQCPKL